MFLQVLKFAEELLYVSLTLFVCTTIYLLRVVKKRNLKFIKEAVANPFFPNLNFSFISELRNEYYKIKKTNVLILINKITFYILLIDIIVLLTLVTLEEFIRAS